MTPPISFPLKDPCYLHPEFSARRVTLVADVCNAVAQLHLELDTILQQIDNIYYDIRLFGFCKNGTRNAALHPKLMHMEALRLSYRFGERQFPSFCNASHLDVLTNGLGKKRSQSENNDSQLFSSQEYRASDRKSGWQALATSGVLVQLLVKFAITGWTIHVCLRTLNPCCCTTEMSSFGIAEGPFPNRRNDEVSDEGGGGS